MAFTLRVVFEGICAFVPSQPLFKSHRPTETIDQMSVLLPDLRLPERAYWDREVESPAPFWRAPHLAYLDVEREFVATGTDARFDHDWLDQASRHRRVAFFLDRHRVRVEGGLGEPLHVDQLRCSGPRPQNPKEFRSLWWLPRLSEIAPDFEWLQGDPGCCERGELPGLAGSIVIQEGRLATREFNRGLDDEIQSWPFGDVKRDTDGDLVIPPEDRAKWKRAIGNQIVWELGIEEAARFVLVDESNAERTVVVRPPLGAGRAPIEVRISNKEPEVGLLGASPFFGALREKLPDPDFQVFYRLGGGGEAPTGEERWAVPLAPDNVHGQHEKPCSPALFSGFSETGG